MSQLSVGEQIREARIAAGMTQVELAQQMGWGHQTKVSGVEAGTRRLTWEEGVALSALIGAPSAGLDIEMIRDAQAYRRILRTIAEREADAIMQGDES